MQKSIYIFTIILAALLFSCGDTLKDSTLQKPDEGSLRLGVATPERKDVSAAAALSRARAELEAPDPATFMITISYIADDDSQSEVLEKLYEALPYTINLAEGNYRVVAQAGSQELFVTENPLYVNKQDFTITRGATTDLSLVATIVPYAVQINYSADFAAQFESYYVEAEINDRSGYVFASHDSDNRMAYLMPSVCRLLLKGVLKDGQKYSSVIKEIDSPGRELYTLNLRILPKGHSIDINVETTRTEIASQGEIPFDNLPEIPAISASALEFYETMVTPIEGSFSAVTFGGIAGLASIEFTPTGDGFNALGLTEGTTYKTSDPTQMAALVAAGVAFPSDWVGKKKATVDFGALAQTLLSSEGGVADYVMQCRVTDITGKVGAVNDLTLRIHPAQFVMPEVLAGDVWTRTATASPLRVDKGDLSYMLSSGRLKYQFSADNANWSDLTADQLAFSGLNPNSTYYVRAVYGNSISNTVSFTTETPAQIPGSDLNNWSSTEPVKNNPIFTVNGGWWATRNSLTNSEGGNNFYCRMSGTKPIDGAVSGKGAELLTIGWGSGNTRMTGLSASVVKYISAATLFVGEYNGGEKFGKPFNSKPTALSFYYRYDPYNGDKYTAEIQIKNGDQVIGQASFKSAEAVGAFTQKVVEVVYDDNYKHLAPTTICVLFKSGDNEGSKDYLKGWVDYGGSFWSGNSSQGSKFYVDEISLVYDK